ncbi:MAG TPA: choice-of-anchor D domain-containing protein, partial [Vulgatibacter sp.]
MGTRVGFSRALVALAVSMVVTSCDRQEPVAPPATDHGGDEAVTIDVEVGLPRDGKELAEKRADFGNVAVDAHVSLSVRIVNRGAREALITGAEVEAPFETDLPQAGLTLAVGGEAAMTLAFEPKAEGDAQGMLVLTVHSGGRAEVIRVRLVGQGLRRVLRCEPEKLEFGLVPVGSSSEVSFRCENPVALPLTLEAPSLAPDIAGVIGFEFAASPAVGPIDLPPAGLLDGKMTFRPLERSFVSGSLPLVSTDGTLVASLVFQGTGVEPPADPPSCEFEVLPPDLDFGVVAPGRSRERRFGIRNLNPAPGASCVVESLRLSAESAPSFSLGIDGGFEVPPQETVEVPVRFSPAEAGPSLHGRALFVVRNGEDGRREV